MQQKEIIWQSVPGHHFGWKLLTSDDFPTKIIIYGGCCSLRRENYFHENSLYGGCSSCFFIIKIPFGENSSWNTRVPKKKYLDKFRRLRKKNRWDFLWFDDNRKLNAMYVQSFGSWRTPPMMPKCRKLWKDPPFSMGTVKPLFRLGHGFNSYVSHY